MAFKTVGNFVARGADKVNPALVDILREAAERTGMNVEAYSGYRPGDRRAHGRGKATDIRIIGDDGKPIPNYQDAGGFSTYEKFAQEARRVQMEKYPELAQQFRWGGYFGGPKGKYGALDTMHFDLAGSPTLGMAGGSWEKGLYPQQAAMFPGVQSKGMGLLGIFDPDVQQRAAAKVNQPQSSQVAAQEPSPPQAPGSPAPQMGAPMTVASRPVMSPQQTPEVTAPPAVIASMEDETKKPESEQTNRLIRMMMAQLDTPQMQQQQIQPMPQQPPQALAPSLVDYIAQYMQSKQPKFG